MTGTYSADLDEPKDLIRFRLGDTTAPFKLEDEEIEAIYLRNNSNVDLATIDLCRGLIARFSRAGASMSVGPFSLSGGELVTYYSDLLVLLQQQISERNPARPFVGGFLRTQKAANNSDGDVEQTFGSKGIMDTNPYDPEIEGYLR